MKNIKEEDSPYYLLGLSDKIKQYLIIHKIKNAGGNKTSEKPGQSSHFYQRTYEYKIFASCFLFHAMAAQNNTYKKN